MALFSKKKIFLKKNVLVSGVQQSELFLFIEK